MNPCLLVLALYVIFFASLALAFVIIPLIRITADDIRAAIEHRELKRELRRHGYELTELSSSMFTYTKGGGRNGNQG